MESANTTKMLDCDCNLYQMKQFIKNLLYDYVRPYIYGNTFLPAESNFQSWMCKLNPILGKRSDQPLSFLDVEDENFICINESLKMKKLCPQHCECLSHYEQPGYYIKCESIGLEYFPKYIPVPDNGAKLVVSLAHNSIVSFPDCYDNGYEWLLNVTSLNMEDNPLSIKSKDDDNEYCKFDRLLRCLKHGGHLQQLFLAQTSIAYIPERIAKMGLRRVSLPNYQLQCDCNTKWLKGWLQENERRRHSSGNRTVIEGYEAIYCVATGKNPSHQGRIESFLSTPCLNRKNREKIIDQ